MSATYAAEKQIAMAAVRRACVLTASVFNKLVKQETLTKDDKSPVTVGDYSAQAVINTILGRTFPQDSIVGEEDSADLRGYAGTVLRERIVELANETLTAPLVDGEKEEWGLGPSQTQTTDEPLDAIDRGNYEGSRTGRFWTLYPIDGTKGFLHGEQYAGAFQLPLDDPLSAAGTRLTIPASTPETLNLLESVEKAHAKLSFNERVAQILGVTRPPTRMDSQAKYCSLARGDGGVYLRMPTGVGYKEKIWDHASGSVLVEEAGGIISDGRGQPLDFGLGRTLGENYGVVGAGKDVHDKVIAGVLKAKSEEDAQKL
ncbi:3',5'-bisphosphate nucleotidase [Trametes maxima]|nr:3',5'-bisphosphate nucleotidase [Trametes maxima]